MAPCELNFLLSTPYFRRCGLNEVAKFSSHLHPRKITAGTYLFTQGEIETGWYLIREGNVQIKRRTMAGIEHVLADLSPGEAFGEMGLLESAPRMACAVASTGAIVLRLDGETFEQLLEDNNRVACQILRAMAVTQSQRLREMTMIMQDLTDMDTLGDYAPLPNPLNLHSFVGLWPLQ
jgi:CRP/FNR family transcriptional regulator, cyclic AMP receptor protein